MAFTCQVPGVEGSSCGTNSDCNSGLYCELFTCQKKKGVGGYCGIADYECQSGLVCKDFYCQERGSAGDSCIGIGQGTCKSGLVCDFYGECRHDPSHEGELCDKTNPLVPTCASGLFCNILRCEERRKAGEECYASGDCASGLECRACFVEGCDYPSQCFPEPSHDSIDEDSCLAMYSSKTHKSAKDGAVTMNFGGGSAATVGVGATDEVGTVYGQDGRYGCYLSYCTGGEASIGISDFATVGFYNSYDDFEDASVNFVQSAGVGDFVSISTAQAFNQDGELMGTQDSFGFGIGLAPPLSVGYYTCNTILRTVIDSPVTEENEPPVAVCSNMAKCVSSATCTVAVSVNGGSYDPDADPITVTQDPAGPFGVGSRTVSLEVSDDSGASDSCSAVVTVRDCNSPSITCPTAATAECAQNLQAMVDPGDATVWDACSSYTVTNPGASSYPLGITPVLYTATDGYGNNATCSVSVTVTDTVAPEVVCPGDVTAECASYAGAAVPLASSAADVCDPTPVLSDTALDVYPMGETTVTFTAKDDAGNTASCNVRVTVTDTGVPEVVCPGDVTAECASYVGVDVPLTATAADVCDSTPVLTDTELDVYPLGDTTVTFTAEDDENNSAGCSMLVTVEDTTPPKIECPEDVTVEAESSSGAVVPLSATAADACDSDLVLTDTKLDVYPLGDTTVTFTAEDDNENTASCTATVTVVDTTPPVIEAHDDIVAEATSPAGAVVTYDSTATNDIVDGAGVATCAPTSGSVFALGETIVTCTAEDAAGNSATPVTFTVKVQDTLPPVIGGGPMSNPNGAGWYNSDVTVHFDCVDSGSGVYTVTGDQILTVEGANRSVLGNCVDLAGNSASATVSGISIDKTAPVIGGAPSSDPNGAGWYNTDVTVHYVCADALSGVGALSEDQTLSAEAAGQSTSGTCVDLAGNSASATVSGISIDKTAPVITLTSPADGGEYALSQNVLAGWSVSDLLSGVVAQSGTTENGIPIDTAVVGIKVYTVSATDAAGNTVTETVTYSVAYDFGGILPPVAKRLFGLLKADFKLGSKIPVKFQLKDAYGAYVPTAVAGLEVSSNGGPWEDATPAGKAASGNIFRYDPVDQQYIFNLETKGLAAGELDIRVTLDDGKSYTVTVRLKK
ncbi:MAG: HYR domain-containing protein [Candidatus Altiarchaeota archaeon]